MRNSSLAGNDSDTHIASLAPKLLCWIVRAHFRHLHRRRTGITCARTRQQARHVRVPVIFVSTNVRSRRYLGHASRRWISACVRDSAFHARRARGDPVSGAFRLALAARSDQSEVKRERSRIRVEKMRSDENVSSERERDARTRTASFRDRSHRQAKQDTGVMGSLRAGCSKAGSGL